MCSQHDIWLTRAERRARDKAKAVLLDQLFINRDLHPEYLPLFMRLYWDEKIGVYVATLCAYEVPCRIGVEERIRHSWIATGLTETAACMNLFRKVAAEYERVRREEQAMDTAAGSTDKR